MTRATASSPVLPVLLSFVRHNLDLAALALLASGMVVGVALGNFVCYIVPGLVFAPASLVPLLALLAFVAVLFHARVLAVAWDRAAYGDSDLPPLALAGGARLLALAALVAAVALPAAGAAAAWLPTVAAAATLGVATLALAALGYYAPHAALVEDCPPHIALRRGFELFARDPETVRHHVAVLAMLIGLPFSLAMLCLFQVVPTHPHGRLGIRDIDIWLSLGFLLGTLAYSTLLLLPPILTTTAYLAIRPELGRKSPRAERGALLPARGAAASAAAAPSPAAATEPAWYTEAMKHIARGRSDEAVALLVKATGLEPDAATAPRLATACLALARMYERRGAREQALSYYEACLRHGVEGADRETILGRIEALRPRN